MLVYNAKTRMICYLFYLETQHAKRYRCGSGMFLSFHICNEIMQSLNLKLGRVRIFLLLCFSHIYTYGVPKRCCGLFYIVSISL